MTIETISERTARVWPEPVTFTMIHLTYDELVALAAVSEPQSLWPDGSSNQDPQAQTS
jgi:hypothetical protein